MYQNFDTSSLILTGRWGRVEARPYSYALIIKVISIALQHPSISKTDKLILSPLRDNPFVAVGIASLNAPARDEALRATTSRHPGARIYCRGWLGVGVQKRVSLLHRTATTRYRCSDQGLAEFPGSWSCRTYPRQSYYFFPE